ncbi:hypothetical protein RJ639_000122 [Escallonia herrerae]|uniref:diacylglycerol O-acyltransferase n=1 Tax=Escallonia herrerae TaxID=1293975 RepID=A0AA89BHQ6_9ASTE|nr:hypothetical protein RJ639_000122 [Escallonia herrerae]
MGGVEDAKISNDDMTVEVEQLSPTARLFHTSRLNCCVIATLGFNTAINVEAFKSGLENTLAKHPRFSSLQVGDDNRRMRWIPTRLNIDNHVFNPEMDPNMASSDQFLEDYLSNLTKTTLDLAKPLWEFHILNIKTSDANGVAILKVHHSVFDRLANL